MSITQPTYDWDFRQTVSAGGTVTDSISGNVATLTSSNASCSTSDGLTIVTDNSTAAGWADLQPFIPSTDGFSYESYFKIGDISWWPILFLIGDTELGQDALLYTAFQHGGGSTFTNRHAINGSNMASSTTMNENTNYHIVITLDAINSVFTVYINGSQIVQHTSSSGFNNGFPNISTLNKTHTYYRIGARGDGLRGIGGNMYYTRFWNGTAISSSEVSTLYANRSAINYFSTSYESGIVPSFDYDFRISNKDLINGTAEAKYYQYSSGTSSEITKTHTSNGVSIVGDTPTAAVSGSSSGRDNAGGQYIDLTGDLDTSYQEITIEVYVNIDSTTGKQVDNAGIFHFGVDDRDEMFKVYTNYGTKDYINMIAQYNDTTTNSITTFTESSLFQNLCDGNTYMHLVYTCNGPTVTVYLNGASFLTNTNSSFSFASTTRSLCELGRSSMYSTIGGFLFATYKYCRIYNTALSSTQAAALYNNRDSENHLSIALLRPMFGDVYLGQNLIKTLADYRTENIPLNDVSFVAFPINKFKDTYILGDVDISGDTILRSNNTYFTDISADTFDVSGNLLISDLSANSRLFVGDDVSFNSNVTIQGDLSLGADISFNAIFTRALADIGTGAGLPMNTDFSMNANLEINGGTTIKNDLHFNAYSDVSANPVLTDGTLLHNQKMEKLDHRYLLDISRSSPFSTLNYNTLPSNIYDNSTNSGICISGDGKYIRTVNSSDVSANALSYYSEDYGSSFQEDKDLSSKLSQFDLSINSLDDYNDYYVIKIPGATYTNEPVGTTGLWTTGGTTSSSFTHSSGTYTVNSDTTLDNSTGTMYDTWRLFGITTDSGTAWGHAMNRTGWSVSSGNIRRHGSKSLTAYDAANSATTYNGDYITITTPYSFLMTQIGFANHWAGNTVNKFMVIGEDSTGTNRVLLSETTHGQGVGSFTTFTVSTTYIVNKFYIHITEINSLNQFTGIRKLRWNGVQADTIIQSFIPKFGSDKVFMSYNGQHQLVPKGVSNKLTYDDFLYVSNNFGKNWNLRKNNTISTTTYSYTVTANGSSNYILNGGGFSSEAQPVVHIYLNESTEFTIDSTTNGNHPFKIGTSENGGEITDSTITSVTSGSNQVITFKPTNSGTFYYYCSSHTGMGSSINVIEPAGRFNLDASGSSWFWNTGAVSADGKHMYVSGKTGLWKSQDFGTSWYQASADSSFNYMSISADGKQVYGVNERKVYGSSDYGNTFSTLYSDSYTSDLSYAGISTSGNGKYITIADISGSNIYMSSNYGNSFELKPVDNYTNFVSLTAAYSWDFRVATPSDNIVKDSIGGLNATYVSGVTSSVADGAYFSGGGTSDGNSPYINLDAFSAGGGYSFETYVKLDATDKFARIFDFGDANGSNTLNYYLGRSGENSTFFFRANEGSPISPGTIVNGVLTHIVAIFSSSGAFSLYQDGALIGTGSGSTTTTVQTRSNNYLGRSNWSVDDAFTGNIHFFRVYASELSSSDITKLYTNREVVITNINCGMSHSGKIVLNSDFISYDYGNNFHYIPSLISNQLTNNDTFYSKANMEYLLDPSNNLMLSIPYKSAQFQDIYSVGSIKVGTTTYSSDYRIKENVEELGEQDTLNELRPVKYYNTNLERNDYGLIAHELQEKYPFLVSGEKDGNEPQSINYNGLISLLVHEIKNLKKEYLELKEMKK